MKQKAGFIFDMDGVIVESNPAHTKAIHAFCKNYDIPITDDYIETQLFGRTNEEWIPDVFGDVSKERIKELADEKSRCFGAILTLSSMWCPGFSIF